MSNNCGRYAPSIGSTLRASASSAPRRASFGTSPTRRNTRQSTSPSKNIKNSTEFNSTEPLGENSDGQRLSEDRSRRRTVVQPRSSSTSRRRAMRDTRSVALAFRRPSANKVFSVNSTPRKGTIKPNSRSNSNRSLSKQAMVEDRLQTIPARVVHDFICLLAILAEYVEWIIILLCRFAVDISKGPTGLT